MRNNSYSKEELLKKYILEKDREISNEIKNSHCPVCGGNLKYILHTGGGDSIVIPFTGEIKCTNCDMFSKKISRDSQQSYHWKYDGSSEVLLKEEVWNSVKPYVKW